MTFKVISHIIIIGNENRLLLLGLELALLPKYPKESVNYIDCIKKMKTRAYILVCQIFEVAVNATPEMISTNYPDFGNSLNFMDRDKITYPEQFGKLVSKQKSLIHCLPVNQNESQSPEKVERGISL